MRSNLVLGRTLPTCKGFQDSKWFWRTLKCSLKTEKGDFNAGTAPKCSVYLIIIGQLCSDHIFIEDEGYGVVAVLIPR